jgi:hypothetical protein
MTAQNIKELVLLPNKDSIKTTQFEIQTKTGTTDKK